MLLMYNSSLILLRVLNKELAQVLITLHHYKQFGLNSFPCNYIFLNLLAQLIITYFKKLFPKNTSQSLITIHFTFNENIFRLKRRWFNV